ncbi:MAG: hypothetical protein NT031_10105, partial [Planctomycetota bacterium]|nr:hypothetical protein [Planctomycetota bacterium]
PSIDTRALQNGQRHTPPMKASSTAIGREQLSQRIFIFMSDAAEEKAEHSADDELPEYTLPRVGARWKTPASTRAEK